METFTAKLGTVFRYNADLSGELYIQFSDTEGGPARVRYRGSIVTTVTIPAIDFLEFAAHVAGLPAWEPEQDDYDRETTRLMLDHSDHCPDCVGTTRCSKYFEVVLERVREKEKRKTH